MTSFQLEITSSPYFVNWLQEHGVSLAFTTYQSNRLFFVGVKSNGRLSAFERLFDRPMGIYAQGHDLYMGGAYQLWKLSNVLESGQVEPGGYDALYVPRTGWTTGDISIHDVALDNAGEAVMVNTAFSCLVKLDDRFSFKPIWQPKFISRLVPEDRCHLYGLAMVNGEPTYVTAVGQTDAVEGWRSHRRDGGVVIDVASDEVVASGLSMPHSPRFYKGKLWVLNSGQGDFGYIDLATGKFEPVTFCAGFTRGLAFYGDYALIGTSKP
ncbi:MAG: TIGR03032 family protein, partial [Pleurocapsa sp.]